MIEVIEKKAARFAADKSSFCYSRSDSGICGVRRVWWLCDRNRTTAENSNSGETGY